MNEPRSQRWAYFAMGLMAGVIVVLALALLQQQGAARAYAAASQATSSDGRGLLMATGMSQQNLSDIVWVLHEHPPLAALARSGEDSETMAKLRKPNRLSLMLYKVERNGTAMKFIAGRDLSYDEELIEWKNESPTVKEVVEALRKQIK